jgi:hypothetical protein
MLFATLLKLLSQSHPWPVTLAQARVLTPRHATYAICLDKPVSRLVGNTEVVYVGSTGLLGGGSDRSRLYAYLYPSGNHSRLINQRTRSLISAGYKLERRWCEHDTLNDARLLEKNMLTAHLAEHLELPPFNGKI